MKRFAALVTAIVLAAPAFAGSCPMLAQQIDRKLQTEPAISETERRNIEQLRDQGMAHHERGEHGQAMDALNAALAELEQAVDKE
jgi:uncharacterized iron-regulated membrane protein